MSAHRRPGGHPEGPGAGEAPEPRESSESPTPEGSPAYAESSAGMVREPAAQDVEGISRALEVPSTMPSTMPTVTPSAVGPVMGPVMGFPGGVGVSGLRVYDWPSADGACGGSPHMHLLCSEAYVVVEGAGSVQTLTWEGYDETPLAPGAVVWFTPGTIHRLVNDDARLRIVVVMQNSGLPEAGDAVFTFPPDVLDDPAAYAEIAAVTDEADARRRRDVAIEGFLALRERGQEGLAAFHRQAARIVSGKLGSFEERWRSGALRAAEATGAHLRALRDGDTAHLRQARVMSAAAEPRLGMCGRLETYRLGE
ncbi:cupin domain-containing protein [Sphaerisporangium sp. NPDC005288]|uniref:cupin domain-containing protein n=1 Tax=Sphaerisporangium sp. NPDC005288 TaxID=3155114 RepID=UPI0033BF715E